MDLASSEAVELIAQTLFRGATTDEQARGLFVPWTGTLSATVSFVDGEVVVDLELAAISEIDSSTNAIGFFLQPLTETFLRLDYVDSVTLHVDGSPDAFVAWTGGHPTFTSDDVEGPSE